MSRLKHDTLPLLPDTARLCDDSPVPQPIPAPVKREQALGLILYITNSLDWADKRTMLSIFQIMKQKKIPLEIF